MDQLDRLPISRHLSLRSLALVSKLEVGLPLIMGLWIVAVSFAVGLRLAFAATPITTTAAAISNVLPYLLVVTAPVITVFLGLRSFKPQTLVAQPTIRLARFGRWRRVDAVTARSLPLFGTGGFMASLMIGILINVPFRTFEFLSGLPALGGMAPDWFRMLFTVMFVDLVFLSCLYGFAFVLALRHVPIFPRFLAGVWVIDVMMQICIARVMAHVSNLPPEVAASLSDMLQGNLKKVLISVTLWLPYLLLSRRVNLTYRLRVPA
ncbi:DUF2569 domain-containing protein [Sphingomonas panacisoli]|uniref:DUF2569 domain-containing protein n=1 Tax=Sphingomonas panacisoli TaxID=1813879 RepID=A0A5B8LK78_9SPHN|nr:DUF2569 family protein [Sphingomonas panacisoli]QDZ08657.1 DUF2569 domain-containing protein [Sphingomonas panacisoli]